MGRRRWAAWAAATAAAAFAMSGGCQPWHCAFWSHGACVEFDYDPREPVEVLQTRFDRLLELELPYWGLSRIDGWRVQYRTTLSYPCYFSSQNAGCTDYLNQTISVRVAPDALDCFEAAELLHELGHYTLGDPMHSAPAWSGVDARFAPIVWDRPDAPASCVTHWRGVTSGAWQVNGNAF